MNVKTNATNQDVMNRMEAAFELISNPVEVDVNAITKEERKLILTRINQIANRKNTTTQDVLNYIDQIANIMK